MGYIELSLGVIDIPEDHQHHQNEVGEELTWESQSRDFLPIISPAAILATDAIRNLSLNLSCCLLLKE
jgi:hypothetical protein